MGSNLVPARGNAYFRGDVTAIAHFHDPVSRGFEIRPDPAVFAGFESCRQENWADDFRPFANLMPDGVQKLAFPFEMGCSG